MSCDVDDLGILLPSAFDLISELIDDIVQTCYVRQVRHVEISDEYKDALDEGCFLITIFDD